MVAEIPGGKRLTAKEAVELAIIARDVAKIRQAAGPAAGSTVGPVVVHIPPFAKAGRQISVLKNVVALSRANHVGFQLRVGDVVTYQGCEMLNGQFVRLFNYDGADLYIPDRDGELSVGYFK